MQTTLPLAAYETHDRHILQLARPVKDKLYRVPESFCEGQGSRNSTRVRFDARGVPRPQFERENEGAPKI